MFRREVIPSSEDPEVFIDSKLGDSGYVDSFGFEWTHIDGFVGKEVMSHGHVFGRFMLPREFFKGKTVVDVGCGNGRIGRLIAPLCMSYCGFDLSKAVYAFPKYISKPPQFQLLQASGTDTPIADDVADVTICWGVLHHMDEPEAAFRELIRMTKPGGTILIFIYSKAFDVGKNLNTFIRGLPDKEAYDIVRSLSDGLDGWREVDQFYGSMLGNLMSLSVKHSREWQIFQWFDGITPRYHWSLESDIPKWAKQYAKNLISYRPGCFVITT
ncbi:MAG: class I SAM-dependent methyltransferase [Marinoscillum sp.]